MKLPADYDPKCKHCGVRIYRYMVTPQRVIWRSSEPGPYPNPLICESVEAVMAYDGVALTLQHECAWETP